MISVPCCLDRHGTRTVGTPPRCAFAAGNALRRHRVEVAAYLGGTVSRSLLLTSYTVLAMFALGSKHPTAGAQPNAPYRTVFRTAGDTIIAHTTGDVPAPWLRKLTVVWKAGGSDASSATSLGNVTDVSIGPDGRVIAWDPATPALWAYGPDGKTARKIGARGSGPGEYTEVNGITFLKDGRFIAALWRNGRMNVYAADGTPQTQWTFPPRFPLGLSSDSTGRVWLHTSIRTSNGYPEGFKLAWIRFDMMGRQLDTILVTDPPGSDTALKATVISPHRIHIENNIPFGRYPSAAPSPFGFVVWGAGSPYVVHSRVNGRPLRIEHEWTPVPIPDAERAQRRAWITQAMQSVDPAWKWTAHDIPRVKPAYNGLKVGLDGRIWVSLNVESEVFNPEKPTGPNSRMPLIRFRPKEQRWDVFEHDGRYLGRVVTPRDVTLYAMRGNDVWGVVRDADDVPSIVKWRVEPAF